MKPRLITVLLASLLLSATHAFSQTPANKPLVGGPKPQDPVPGLIVRVNLGDGKNLAGNATHLLCIVQSGKDWFDKYKEMAANELRGASKIGDPSYHAFGFIIVDKDTEVVFDVEQNICKVGGKGFGYGTYRHTFKKGKYPIEIYRHYGHGMQSFEITGANGEHVLFHTGEMLSRELNRSEKIERKTYKSKMLGAAS